MEVKDQLLLMYLMDLSHLILDKASGGSLQGHPAVLRLVEIRTVQSIWHLTGSKLLNPELQDCDMIALI